MQEAYIDIMLRSLDKKIEVLEEIMKVDETQKSILEQADGTVEAFDETVDRKSGLLEQLEHLDNGFEKLYGHVKEELQADKEKYKEQIERMKGSIRYITDMSMEIQSQEARNKDLMTMKFTKAKEQGRTMRKNSGVVAQYYQNMTRTSFVDPQFWDGKQ